MKKGFTYLLLIALTISLQSCLQSPDDVPYAAPEPVFFVEGIFDGEPRLIEAGRNEFFMFTNFSKDSLEVYNFTGRIAKLIGCSSNCEEDFTFTIRDSKVSEGESLPFENGEGLVTGAYNFFASESQTFSPTFEVKFVDHSVYSGELEDITWDNLSNISIISPDSAIDTFPNLDFLAGITINTSDNCSSTYSTLIHNNLPADCFYPIDFEIDTTDFPGLYEITAVPLPGATDDVNFSWNESGFAESLIFDSDNTYCVTISDTYGCSSERCVTIGNTAEGLENIEYCSAGFSYEVTELGIPTNSTEFFFSNVILDYTDENGVWYSSRIAPQPPGSSFEIQDIDEFDFNEQNLPTLRLDINFNCTLFNPQGGPNLVIENGKASVGVAYPLGN